jgi:hypothetical protein
MNEHHEHVFYPHEDPRWLVCDCGQHAARTKTRHGQASFRLVDPPGRAFGVTDTDTVTVTVAPDASGDVVVAVPTPASR